MGWREAAVARQSVGGSISWVILRRRLPGLPCRAFPSPQTLRNHDTLPI